MRNLTQAQSEHVSKLVASGVHHRVAIRYAVTGTEYNHLFRAEIISKLAKACKEYERINGIKDGAELTHGRTYI